MVKNLWVSFLFFLMLIYLKLSKNTDFSLVLDSDEMFIFRLHALFLMVLFIRHKFEFRQ